MAMVIKLTMTATMKAIVMIEILTVKARATATMVIATTMKTWMVMAIATGL